MITQILNYGPQKRQEDLLIKHGLPCFSIVTRSVNVETKHTHDSTKYLGSSTCTSLARTVDLPRSRMTDQPWDKFIKHI